MIEDIGNIRSSDGGELLKMWSVGVSSGERPLQKHSHIRFEIALIEEGGGIYTKDGREYKMSVGDIFVFSSNEQHCITNVSAGGLKFTNLHFEPRYLWGYSTDSLSEAGINICFSHNSEFENRIPAERTCILGELFLKIKNEFLQKNQEYSLTVKSYLNLFLIELIRNFDFADKKSSLSRDKLHSIRRVIKHIDNNLCEELSLSRLAAIAGMSPNYFSSLFHTVSGITLWDYINSKRIDNAMRLLTEGDRSILEIAALSGYNNTANFNKAFRKVTGITPREYRASGGMML